MSRCTPWVPGYFYASINKDEAKEIVVGFICITYRLCNVVAGQNRASQPGGRHHCIGYQ